MEKFLSRKPTRLKNYNYGLQNLYFITICVQDRKQILSEIELCSKPDMKNTCLIQYEDFAMQIKLKPCGVIAEEQLLALEKRYPCIELEDYVIMPDHIHAILYLKETGGASPSPTINDVVCAFKSLTSRLCKKQFGVEKIFQRSFADHIIRDFKDYELRKNYNHDNPRRWYSRISE